MNIDILDITNHRSPIFKESLDLIHSRTSGREIRLDSSTTECVTGLDRPRSVREPKA
jgi:hypothetical protein